MAGRLLADHEPLGNLGVRQAFAEQRQDLALATRRELDWSWRYPDLETALRGLLSPGISAVAIHAAGERDVREALTCALEPFRMTDGSYRLENAVHCLVATAR